jgi:hypothetical protein
MLLMDLDVLSKFCTDVLIIINLDSGHEFSWVNVAGNTICRRVYVEPKVTGANHLYDEHCRESFEREGVPDATTSFLEGTDVLFSYWYMFLTGALVEFDPHTRECSTEGFKLTVSLDNFEEEATFNINLPNFGEVLQDRIRFGIFQPGYGSKFYCPTPSHKKRNLVDFHHINAQYDSLVLCHDCRRDRDQSTGSDLLGSSPYCLSL